MSPSQNAVFRPLVKAAYHVHCGRVMDMPPFDPWYREQLGRLGWTSTKDLATRWKDGHSYADPDDFRELLLHFATIAGDTPWISRLATEHERRMKWLILQRLGEIGRLDPEANSTWNYARRVCAHMNLPLALDDCPVEWLSQVFKALDVHAARLRRNNGRSRPHYHGGPPTGQGRAAHAA